MPADLDVTEIRPIDCFISLEIQSAPEQTKIIRQV